MEFTYIGLAWNEVGPFSSLLVSHGWDSSFMIAFGENRLYKSREEAEDG